jgi:plastocyanin
MRRLPLLALVGALFAGCTTPEATTAIDPASASDVVLLSASPEGQPRPYEFTTAIQDEGYQHERLDATVHATIRWWNVDDEAHSVVSDDGQFPGSGPIPPHGEFTYTFLRAGDFTYHCRYHPEMNGIVVVR